METRLELVMLPQTDDTTCGPSCLQSVYRYYGDPITLDRAVEEVRQLKSGGTLEVFLACHALRRGYDATIYTYNLSIFDPTWFSDASTDLSAKLMAQARAKEDAKLHAATEGYLEFLELGGRLRFEDLTAALIRKYLNRSAPVLAGLSSTYLYRTAREHGVQGDFDDVIGTPSGHFVILCGYDKERRRVLIADPMSANPISESHYYEIGIDRVLCAILLGVLSYDANLLIITPKTKR